MKKCFRSHGLSIVILTLFLITWVGGQFISGWTVHNEERKEAGRPPLALTQYLTDPHFVSATMENWESEFLQMFIYIVVTAFLFQRGSAESNDPDRPPEKHPITARSPWPVRKGGGWLRLYSHSLSLAFAGLFLVSFCLHAWSSARVENEHRRDLAERPISIAEHLRGSKFWFESFQNWQSEFLAIGSMVILSIFLRERNSPESKAVEAPHSETGA